MSIFFTSHISTLKTHERDVITYTTIHFYLKMLSYRKNSKCSIHCFRTSLKLSRHRRERKKRILLRCTELLRILVNYLIIRSNELERQQDRNLEQQPQLEREQFATEYHSV